MTDMIEVYASNLRTSQEAQDYLHSRGVTEDQIAKYKIGYFDKTEYSQFYDRIIFPIFRYDGELLGFQGRALGDVKPKYYHNVQYTSRMLFGLYENGRKILKNNYAFVVEGIFDVLALELAGYYAVATFGTTISKGQALLLRRYVDDVFHLYDNDSAGKSGEAKSVENCRKAGVKYSAVDLKIQNDVSDYLQLKGANSLARRVKMVLNK